jgi:outer membrane receptor protein involved in Fe transport
MLHALPMRSLFLILTLCLLTSLPVFAQIESATLSGVITDPNGRVVPDAEVTVTRIETGGVVTNRTNGAGIYTFTGLMPGHYHLALRKPGFKEIAIKEFELHVQDKLEQNFSLEIGSISETVTVTGKELNLNTTDAAVSTVIDRDFVSQLPLNGRSFNTLLQLTPGVVIAPTAASNPGTGQFSVAGQRQDANNFIVDGVSANFGISFGLPQTSGTGNSQALSALGGTSSLVSVDALQEFRIETSSFAPEFGRNTGGQVILNTRSGTNDFHGGVFDYFRNTVLDANNWFANQGGLPRAAERHNDFGGFFGGPIWKDKTFFFFSYEGARLQLPTTISSLPVPSAFARSFAQTNTPALAPYLNGYPQPNDQTITPGVFTATFTGNSSNPASLDATSIRIDHTFNARFSIFGRYNDAPSSIVSPLGAILLSTATNTKTLTVGVNMLLTNRIVNTVRGNYSSQNSGGTDLPDRFGGAVPPDPSLFLGSLPANGNGGGFTSFDLFSFYGFGGNHNRTRQANFVDDVSVSVGAHQLKFGGDYRAIFVDLAPGNTLSNIAALSIQDLLTTQTAFVVSVTSNQTARLLAQTTSLYGQDTWRATPRLTLTYGLRWEVTPAPSARGKTVLASWKNTNDPAQIALAPIGTPLWYTRYGNLAPRLGIAYRLDQSGSFLIRIGGGVFFDPGTGAVADLGEVFPSTAVGRSFSVQLPITNLTPFLPAPVSLQPPFPDGVYGYASNFKLPRSYQWNVALEKMFAGNQVISATYLGQAGRDLTRQQALEIPNPNFAGAFLLTQNSAFSNYDALQVQYRRPISHGLQALLSYAWSHSLDNSSNDVVAGLSNTVISNVNDYASSDFDVRHSVSGALTYNIPAAGKNRALSLLTKDWSIDTVIVARSGFPFNEIIHSTSPGGGFASSRPDRVAGQPLYLFGMQCTQAFGPVAQGGNGVLEAGQSCPGGQGLNPAAFVIPSTTRQGTEGRNDIPGFGLTQIDLSIGRKFSITERVSLQFRIDAFNVLNHPNFTNPSGQIESGLPQLLSTSTLNNGLTGLNPLFQEGGPRSLQLSLKLTF